MFEEAADDGPNANVFAATRNTRAQAAEATYDQVDGYASLRGGAQCLDNLRVFQLVHLGHDASRSAEPMVFDLALY
jgi:hypothetical protein